LATACHKQSFQAACSLLSKTFRIFPYRCQNADSFHPHKYQGRKWDWVTSFCRYCHDRIISFRLCAKSQWPCCLRLSGRDGDRCWWTWWQRWWFV
jgi:hypothetical protein